MTTRSSLTILVLLAILILMQYRLWFESGGIQEMGHLNKKLSEQMKENAELKKRNEELLFAIKRLQNSQEALESRARSELGMVKKGETFYQIVKG